MRKRSEITNSGATEAATKEEEQAQAVVPFGKGVSEFMKTLDRSVVVGFDQGVEGSDYTTVTATWGEEQFSPVQYNTFRVGPFIGTTKVRPGETVVQATMRLHAELDEAAQKIVRDKAAGFVRSLKGICEQAGRR